MGNEKGEINHEKEQVIWLNNLSQPSVSWIFFFSSTLKLIFLILYNYHLVLHLFTSPKHDELVKVVIKRRYLTPINLPWLIRTNQSRNTKLITFLSSLCGEIKLMPCNKFHCKVIINIEFETNHPAFPPSSSTVPKEEKKNVYW